MKREFLYLLQVLGKSTFKIGITGDLEKRLEAINKSLKKNKVVVIAKVKTYNAKDKEQFLHDLFACSRITWRGSGKTEYFRLNWLEVIFVMIWLWWFKWRGLIWISLASGVALFFYFKIQ